MKTMKFLKILLIFAASLTRLYADEDKCKITNESTGVVYTNLQDAIDDASIVSTDTLEIKGKCKGNFIITKSIILQGKSNAILDGKRQGRVLDITGTDINVTLKDLTIQHGRVIGNGGGILFAPQSLSTLNLEDVEVSNNLAAGGAGGGIFYDGSLSSGYVTIIDSEMEENTALTTGGGISILTGTLIIKNSEISSNSSGGDGGGLFTTTGSIISIKNTEVSDNQSAANGGGLAFEIFSGVEVIDSEIERNQAAVLGGGIFNLESVLTITETEIQANRAGLFGGGLFITTTGLTTTIEKHSKIAYNLATDGGGIYNASGILIIAHSKLEHNRPNEIHDL